MEITITKTLNCQNLKVEDKNISRYTVSKMFTFLRHISSINLNRAEIILGGNNSIVEIDESLFGKVKYNKGKDLKKNKFGYLG